MPPDEAIAETAPSLTVQGNAALEAGKFAEALEAFTKATEEDGSDASAWFGRALTHTNLNQAAEAEKAIERALELAPDLSRDAIFLLARAKVWNALGEADQSP